jgi:hypothetical protein
MIIREVIMTADLANASWLGRIDNPLYCRHITAPADAWQWLPVMIAFSNQI